MPESGLGFNGVVIDLQHLFMICLNFQNLHKFRTEIYDIVVDFEQLCAVESRSCSFCRIEFLLQSRNTLAPLISIGRNMQPKRRLLFLKDRKKPTMIIVVVLLTWFPGAPHDLFSSSRPRNAPPAPRARYLDMRPG